MTQKEKAKYRDADELRKIVERLKGEKFRLDCGHHVTFGYHLGNDITIRKLSKNITDPMQQFPVMVV